MPNVSHKKAQKKREKITNITVFSDTGPSAQRRLRGVMTQKRGGGTSVPPPLCVGMAQSSFLTASLMSRTCDERHTRVLERSMRKYSGSALTL